MKKLMLYILLGAIAAGTVSLYAQNSSAGQQLRADFLQAIDNSTVDDQQKAELRSRVNDDFAALKEAKQQRDRNKAREIFQDLKSIANESGFTEEDKQKIAEDLKQFPAAR